MTRAIASPPEWAGEFRRALWAAQNGRCHYCNRRTKSPGHHNCGPAAATLDHVLPVALGGTADPVNLVVACLSCNSAKGDMHPAEWLSRFGRRWEGATGVKSRPARLPRTYPSAPAAPAVILYRPEPGEIPECVVKYRRELEAKARKLAEKGGGP